MQHQVVSGSQRLNWLEMIRQILSKYSEKGKGIEQKEYPENLHNFINSPLA